MTNSRKLFLEKRQEKLEKLERIPFSDYHNKLVNTLYSSKKDSLKKAARKAAHEEKIKQISIKLTTQKLVKAFEHSSKNKQHLFIINVGNWNIHTFATFHSSLSFEKLRKIGIELLPKIKKYISNFFDIEIWDKDEYLKRINGELATYRYQIS